MRQRSLVSAGPLLQEPLADLASAVRVAADQALLPLLAVLACQQLHKDPAASARQSSLASVVEAPLPLIIALAQQRLVHLDSAGSLPLNGATNKARNIILRARR